MASTKFGTLIYELNNGIPVTMHNSFHGLHDDFGPFSAAFCELLNISKWILTFITLTMKQNIENIYFVPFITHINEMNRNFEFIFIFCLVVSRFVNPRLLQRQGTNEISQRRVEHF